MEGCRTCAERMRAGLPPGWRAADKTGSGNRGAVNDVGLVWPPAGGPIVIASYLSDSDAQLAPLAAAHAAVARVVVRDLGPPMR
jgi:beta-lactamase class A